MSWIAGAIRGSSDSEAVKLVRGGLPFDQVLGLQAQEPSWPTNGLPPNYLPQANIDGI